MSNPPTPSPTPEETWERIDKIPSHISPPADGIVYVQIDRLFYRASVGTYKGWHLFASSRASFMGDGLARDLWLLRPGQDDQKITDNDDVTIDRSGMRFFTTARYVNGG